MAGRGRGKAHVIPMGGGMLKMWLTSEGIGAMWKYDECIGWKILPYDTDTETVRKIPVLYRALTIFSSEKKLAVSFDDYMRFAVG